MKPRSAIVIVLLMGAALLIGIIVFRVWNPDTELAMDGQTPAGPATENEIVDDSEEIEEDEHEPSRVSFDSLEFEAEVLQENLNIPWEIRYLHDEDDWLITQRSGELLSLNHGQVAVIDETAHIGEGGLLGMALDPDFNTNRYLYLYVTTDDGGQLINRILRYTYEDQALSERTMILDQIPGDSIHNGGRIAFGPDNLLYITTGDARDPDLSQQEESLAGKILRIAPDGSIPDDNPFPGSPVYSIGHRNPQGISWHPDTGDLYSSEHGPTRMDEVNLILPGRNYGWPIVTCDEAPTDYEDPVTCYSDFTLAPSGTTFYQPDFIEGTHLLVSGLRGNQVRRIELDDEGGVVTEEELFTEWGRIRAVHEMDGDIYLITSNHSGPGSPGPEDDRFIRLRVSRPE